MDPVTRAIAFAAYARAAGCCPPCSLSYGQGFTEGALRPELLDAGDPLVVGVLRELDRAALRCVSARHLGSRQ